MAIDPAVPCVELCGGRIYLDHLCTNRNMQESVNQKMLNHKPPYCRKPRPLPFQWSLDLGDYVGPEARWKALD